MESVDLLGLRVHIPRSIDELLAEVEGLVGRGGVLVPLNPIKVMRARRERWFWDFIARADIVFPDAWGISWAVRVLHGRKTPVLPGYRVALRLLGLAEERGWRVFLLGTKSHILEEAVREIKKQHPKIKLVGHHHGFYADDAPRKLIGSLEPDLVLVGMGEVRQEREIALLRKFAPRAVMMGVGGTFDLVAGHQPKPPEWMVRHHMEWLFRAVRQPWRLPRFKALPAFAARVIWTRMKR